MASGFSPSESLFYPMLNYILGVMKDQQEPDEIRSYAAFVFARFFNFYLRDNRKECPSDTEIKYVAERKQIQIPVVTADEHVVPLFIESYTTANEAKKQMLEKLSLPVEKEICYNFLEVCEKNQQTGNVKTSAISLV
jgi:hypothetical protein